MQVNQDTPVEVAVADSSGRHDIKNKKKGHTPSITNGLSEHSVAHSVWVHGTTNGGDDGNASETSTGVYVKTVTNYQRSVDSISAAAADVADLTLMHRQSQVLLGTQIAHAEEYKDDNNVKCIFFIFNDLSVRCSGKYRLKFQLFQLPSNIEIIRAPAAFVISEQFTVYSPKTFPGMPESTQLSRALAKQGAKIHIRERPTKNLAEIE